MLGSLVLSLLCVHAVVAVVPQHPQSALLQSWSKALESSATTSKDTPVTRVVNLLKEMSATLQKEMDEDEALFDKLGCWCNNNQYEKNAAVEAATAKISELKSTIDSSAAHSAELQEDLKQLEQDLAADKAALAEAVKQRAKESKAFVSTEKASIANIESVRQAIKVLSEHVGSAFPQFSVSASDEVPADSGSFLQASVAGWSATDTAVVRRALKSASAFMQQKQETFYAPQSGEIQGVLKQLKDEMSASLSDAQKAEAESAATFNELRTAKTNEIENAERTSERKEDELATTNNALAEAKEDLDQTTSLLSADQKFLVNLKATCSDADGAFEKRKAARLQEIKAVAETIEILTADEARDNMAATYSFIQTASSRVDVRRQQAAAVLRKAGSPDLSMMATSVELDSFARVKKAIDGMISQLKTQQADEVKKADWCKGEFQSNDMNTMKANSLKDQQDAKLADLASSLEKLTDEVAQANKDIAQLQLELQRATENRKAANMDFQKTIQEQVATQEVLKAALEKLAKFYDSFVQVHAKSLQTPPVAQMTYEKNAGASGVMSMIEKLIHEAKGLEADSRKSEQAEQAQYESLVADTNDSVNDLQKMIVTKTSEKAEATQEKIALDGDLKDTEGDIERLAKYDADLHGECDYIQKNFDTRQEARQQEIEALQQAKQILSGAAASSR